MKTRKEWKVGDLCLHPRCIGLAVVMELPRRAFPFFRIKSVSVSAWDVAVDGARLRMPTKRALAAGLRLMDEQAAEINALRRSIRRAQKPPRQ